MPKWRTLASYGLLQKVHSKDQHALYLIQKDSRERDALRESQVVDVSTVVDIYENGDRLN